MCEKVYCLRLSFVVSSHAPARAPACMCFSVLLDVEVEIFTWGRNKKHTQQLNRVYYYLLTFHNLHDLTVTYVLQKHMWQLNRVCYETYYIHDLTVTYVFRSDLKWKSQPQPLPKRIHVYVNSSYGFKAYIHRANAKAIPLSILLIGNSMYHSY